MTNEPNFEFPALRDAQAKLNAARQRQVKIFEQAGPEMDLKKVTEISGSTEDKVKAIQQAEAEMADFKKEVENLKAVAIAAANAKGYGRESGDGREERHETKKVERKSFEEQIAGVLPALRDFSKGRKGSMPDVELKTLFSRTAGWDPFDARDSRVELTPLRPAVHVVNYIPSGTISQSDYKYMEETTHTSNAAELAEAATYGESAFALTERSRPVEKIGAWVPVTDEQLEDEPAASAYLHNRLTQQIQRRLDSQVLVGDGSTPNLLGTETVVGIQAQAKGTDTIPDAFRKLLTKFQDDGFCEASVAFIRPVKWQDVVLERTADGLYVWGHPSTVGPQTMWGVPVIPTTAVTATKIVAGDYATYAMLFLRRGMDVQVTNSHGTHFVEGKQAIRADIRATLVHFRPKAFGTVTGL